MPEEPDRKPQENSLGQAPTSETAAPAVPPMDSEEEKLLRKVADVESESDPVTVSAESAGDSSGSVVLSDNAPKNKKKLIIIALAAVIILVFAGGGTLYALWFNHPDTVTSDAVKNLVNAKTMINEGSYTYQDSKSKTSLDLAFKSQSDVPAYAGSIDVDAKIKYESLTINAKGSGMVSKSGTVYFKLQNVSQLVNRALESDYGKLYVSTPGLKDAIKKFVTKIENKWVKLEQSDLALFSGSGGNEQVCYKKAIAAFYSEGAQRSQVVDAYNQNRFFIFKEAGLSQIVNGQDSLSYTVGYDVTAADGFEKALGKTDIGKALEKCSNNGVKPHSFDDGQSSKEKQKQLEREQKEADKTVTTLWISRWSHELTKIETTSNDQGAITKFDATFQPNKPLQLSDPKDFITFEQLQTELSNVFLQAQQSFSGSSEAVLLES